LPYRIEYVQTAINHLRYLTARQRSVVFTGVDQQLMHEPTAETRNRKQMRANPLASWDKVIQFSNLIPMRVNARSGWAATRRHAAAMLE
jgi:hypothetical protein